MTLDEFFEKLPNDGWALLEGRIRNGLCECPIECVAGVGPWNFSKGAAVLNLGYPERWAIIVAADNQRGQREYDPALRARLLAHCGLKES